MYTPTQQLGTPLAKGDILACRFSFFAVPSFANEH